MKQFLFWLAVVATLGLLLRYELTHNIDMLE